MPSNFLMFSCSLFPIIFGTLVESSLVAYPYFIFIWSTCLIEGSSSGFLFSVFTFSSVLGFSFPLRAWSPLLNFCLLRPGKCGPFCFCVLSSMSISSMSSSIFSSSFSELLLLADGGVKFADENIEASSSEVVAVNCPLPFSSLSLALLPLVSFSFLWETSPHRKILP